MILAFIFSACDTGIHNKQDKRPYEDEDDEILS
jgi:hypothetical protein